MRQTSGSFWFFTAMLVLLMSATNTSQQRKQKVIFFGDSITQAAVQPGGYIEVMKAMLKEQKLEDNFEFIGAGIGGNKVYDLYLRMEEDVLSKKPDIVVVYVGVNDVWHKQSHGTGTDADKFGKFYNAMVSKFKANNIKVVVCTPAVIGERTDFSNQLDGDLNHYSNIIRQIASSNSLPVVDLRKAFLAHNLQYNKENRESGILTTDRVHLNEAGNKLVAATMWDVIIRAR